MLAIKHGYKFNRSDLMDADLAQKNRMMRTVRKSYTIEDLLSNKYFRKEKQNENQNLQSNSV